MPLLQVIIVNSTDPSHILSNPIPFIIRLEDKPEESYSPTAAIFAGVLVLVIVFLALFIPFVVRAKRRMRAGKPVMKMGSHAGSEVAMDRRVSADFLDLSRKPTEPNLYGQNPNFDYKTEVRREKNKFTSSIKHMDDDHQEHPRATFSIGDTPNDHAKRSTKDDNSSEHAKRPVKGILRQSDTNLSGMGSSKSSYSGAMEEEISKL